jgi:hypothetical protein
VLIVTVLSPDNESTSKVFGAISEARKWANSGALNEFDGDVAAITIHEADAENPRRAIDQVRSGSARFVEGKVHPMTAEQRGRADKAEAHRFLAKLGLQDWRR